MTPEEIIKAITADVEKDGGKLTLTATTWEVLTKTMRYNGAHGGCTGAQAAYQTLCGVLPDEYSDCGGASNG